VFPTTPSSLFIFWCVEHDQSYYVDIGVGFALLVVGGVIMALWP
jgi:hypothetical protein